MQMNPQQEMGHNPYGAYNGGEQPTFESGNPQQYEQQHYGQPLPGAMPGQQSQQQQFYGQTVFYTPQLPDGRVSAALSYSLGWLSGLLFLLFGWQNRFVRFHALQSLFFFGAINFVDIVLFGMIYNMRHETIGYLLLCVFAVVNLVAAIGWVIGMFQAVSGNYYKMPVVGEIAERIILPQQPLVK